jgi:hypothetical protein
LANARERLPVVGMPSLTSMTRCRMGSASDTLPAKAVIRWPEHPLHHLQATDPLLRSLLGGDRCVDAEQG